MSPWTLVVDLFWSVMDELGRTSTKKKSCPSMPARNTRPSTTRITSWFPISNQTYSTGKTNRILVRWFPRQMKKIEDFPACHDWLPESISHCNPLIFLYMFFELWYHPKIVGWCCFVILKSKAIEILEGPMHSPLMWHDVAQAVLPRPVSAGSSKQ